VVPSRVAEVLLHLPRLVLLMKVTHSGGATTPRIVWAETSLPDDPIAGLRIQAELVELLAGEVGPERAENGTLHIYETAGATRVRLVAAP